MNTKMIVKRWFNRLKNDPLQWDLTPFPVDFGSDTDDLELLRERAARSVELGVPMWVSVGKGIDRPRGFPRGASVVRTTSGVRFYRVEPKAVLRWFEVYKPGATA